jgi:hypothetical protein
MCASALHLGGDRQHTASELVQAVISNKISSFRNRSRSDDCLSRSVTPFPGL